MSIKNILILDDGGMVGPYLIKNLSDNKHKITVICLEEEIELKVYGYIGQIDVIKISHWGDHLTILPFLSKHDVIINLTTLNFPNSAQSEQLRCRLIKFLIPNLRVEQTLIHTSSLMSEDPGSSSAKSRIEGEKEVVKQGGCIVKASFIFGSQSNFTRKISKLLQVMPIILLPCNPTLRPVYAGDVGRFIANLIGQEELKSQYILQGKECYSLAEIFKKIARALKLERKISISSWAKGIGLILQNIVARIALRPFVGNYEPLCTQEEIVNLRNYPTTQISDYDCPTSFEHELDRCLGIKRSSYVD